MRLSWRWVKNEAGVRVEDYDGEDRQENRHCFPEYAGYFTESYSDLTDEYEEENHADDARDDHRFPNMRHCQYVVHYAHY